MHVDRNNYDKPLFFLGYPIFRRKPHSDERSDFKDTQELYKNRTWTLGKNGTWIHRRSAVGQSIVGPIRPLALRSTTEMPGCTLPGILVVGTIMDSQLWRGYWTNPKWCLQMTCNTILSFFDWQCRPETFHPSFQQFSSTRPASKLILFYTMSLWFCSSLLMTCFPTSIDLFSLNTSPAFVPNPHLLCMVPRILSGKIPMIYQLNPKEIQNGASNCQKSYTRIFTASCD